MLTSFKPISAAAILLAAIACASAQSLTANTVLILYDSTGQYGWIGGLHARMLANLLGHFQLPYQITPVESYRAGDVNLARATFYFGTLYNNPLPAAFRQDALATSKPMCWLKYNLAQIGGAQFESKFGFRFNYMDSSGFSVVNYKGESFLKDQHDPELGFVSILNPALSVSPATACRTNATECIPYIVRAGNFWYVADSPFAYISEEDRYLVFCDLLHDILQIAHPESHHAIIRIEDIDPTYPASVLQPVADYLSSQSVPFAVSVIPMYVDPFGYYSDGVPEQFQMSSQPEFIQAINYMVGKGAQIVLHGYTHQYNSVTNPFTGVTGDDYEFFRVTLDAQTNVVDYMPVPEDSTHWARGRVNAALRELSQSGFAPVAWETPHYAASAVDYQLFASKFSLTIQRALYFDDAGHVAGQFFPYIIHQDIYGQKIIPENIGNVDPYPWLNYPPRLPADMIRAARKNRVVRDGWASGYFHAFLDISYLQELVQGVKALGYTYVPVAPSGPPVITLQPQSQTNTVGSQINFSVAVIGSEPFNYQWRRSGTNLSGATSATLTLTNLQLASAGTYSVAVNNSAGSVISSNAVLGVITPPLISRISLAGNSVTISFPTQIGRSYYVEYKNSLSVSGWTALTNRAGNGVTVTAIDSNKAAQARFYRIRTTQP